MSQQLLQSQGYCLIPRTKFRHILEGNGFFPLTGKENKDFINSWNDLDIDNFMADKGKYRTRKHATFNIKKDSQHIIKYDYRPHYQTINYNTLNGGVERYFTEIDAEIINNHVFQNLLKFANQLFSKIKSVNWFVEVHQFRIEASKNSGGKPTPEGVHRDGVDFVLMAMINRQNVTGGITKIYDLDKNLIGEFQLTDYLDVALVNDHKVFHGVSEIFTENITQNEVGFRDVLVITFKEAK